MRKLLININILILPFLNILMFIILSSFGQTFMMELGLSFIFSLVFMLIYVSNFKKIPAKINTAFILLMAYSLIKSLIANDLYYGFISIGTISSLFLLTGLKMDKKNWEKSFLITSIFSTIVLLLYNKKYVLINWNPNSIGSFCSLGMMMSILALFMESNKGKKIIIFLFAIYQILQLYLTDCRTATFIFFIALIFSIYLNFFIKKKTSKVYFIFLIVCLSTTLLATQYVKLTNSNIFDWLVDLSKNLFKKSTLFSDREYIWGICDYITKDFWILGSGKSLYHTLYAHNMYYSIQYTYGFVGYMLYSLFIFTTCNYIYKGNKNNDKCTFATIIIFAAILLGQITENTMFTSNSNIFMSYIYLAIGLSLMKGVNQTDEKVNSIYTNL